MRASPQLVFSFLFLPPLPQEPKANASFALREPAAAWAYGLHWLRQLAQSGFGPQIRVVMGGAGFDALSPENQAFLQSLTLDLVPEKDFLRGGGAPIWRSLRSRWQRFRHQQALQKLLKTPPSPLVVWEEKPYRAWAKRVPVFCPTAAQHLPAFVPIAHPSVLQGSSAALASPGTKSPDQVGVTARENLQWVNDQISAGAAYFLVRDAATQLDDILVLLKAFSLFKKWTKSNMKMVFAEKSSLAIPGFREKLEHYKFRNDLVFWEGGAVGRKFSSATSADPSAAESPTLSLEALTAAAYAVVLPQPQRSWAWGFVDAVLARVPVLVPEDFTLNDAWDGKRYMASFHDPDSLGAQLQLLYRNEKLRGERLEAAADYLHALDGEAETRAFWEAAQGFSPNN